MGKEKTICASVQALEPSACLDEKYENHNFSDFTQLYVILQQRTSCKLVAISVDRRSIYLKEHKMNAKLHFDPFAHVI